MQDSVGEPWFVDEKGLHNDDRAQCGLTIVVDESLSEATYTNLYNSAVLSQFAREREIEVHVVDSLFFRKDAPY